MSDQFGKQATFILPDGEKITVPVVGELKPHKKRRKPRIVVVWGAEEKMTEMYLGIRDLETGKIKKTLPSSYLVTAQRDPETGKILRLIPDETETKA